MLIQIFLTALTAYVLTRQRLSATTSRAEAAAVRLMEANITGSPAKTARPASDTLPRPMAVKVGCLRPPHRRTFTPMERLRRLPFSGRSGDNVALATVTARMEDDDRIASPSL